MKARELITALVLGLTAFFLILGSCWNDSPCYDEPEHITAGFTYVRYGVFFMNPFHPPLVKDLAGLAVQWTLAPAPLQGWSARDHLESVTELFLNQDPQTLVRVARAPIIALSAAFVALFFLTLSESRGYLPAVLAALMLTLSPTFLAHAGFVHNDAAAAAFVFLSLWLLRGYLQNPPDGRRLFAFALVAGTAQVVKFSCLVLYPVYLIAISLEKDRWSRWKQVPLVFLTGLVIVYAVYAVHPIGRPYPLFYRDLIFKHRDTLVQRTLDAAHESPLLRPLTWYATGVLAQGAQVRLGAPSATFMGGELVHGGHWLYFPKLLLFKIPLGLLGLVMLSAWGLKKPDRELRLYLLFTAVYLAVALSASLNLGVRHLLPVFPCVLAVAGQGLARVWEERGRAARGVMAVAAVLLGLSTAVTFPNYLSYYNLLAPARPFAVDSNYDWGTDLLRLQQRLQETSWEPVYFYYFGSQPVARAYLQERAQTLDLQNLPQHGYLAASPSLYLPLLRWLDLELPPEHQDRQERFRRWVDSLTEVERVGTLQILVIGDEKAP